MNNRLSICILLCLAMLASGLAEAQGTYGTKVQAGDPDIGLPLSQFAPIGSLVQNAFWISYWDLNANGLYDAQDVPYLQFGSINFPGLRIVRANNIRLTSWENYPAGSYVKASDPDIGQPLNTVPPLGYALTSVPAVGFYYLNVAGTAGYDLEDPVYLKVLSAAVPPLALGTNDIRITGFANYPAGSRVSITDPDAGKALTAFVAPILPPAANPIGGPSATATLGQIGSFMFFNANGNVLNPFFAIFDDGDVVYFHVGAGGAGAAVGPNDIRLF